MTLLQHARRGWWGYLRIHINDEWLPAGEQRVREEPTEARMLEVLIFRVEVDKGLVHVDLPHRQPYGSQCRT